MKTQKFKSVASLLTAVLFTTIFMLVAYGQDVKPWPVPDEYKSMDNPYDADKRGLAVGKALYNKHCKSCHGAEGLGDGTRAAGLDTYCGDFTSEEFQGQSDGAIFYKTTEGRDEMPSFKKTIPDDEDRWLIVHYMRTLE